MMEQHPIPQQISSYEFKLVGEMTLKQFFKAGIGIGIALLINTTKMYWLIRWPLMIGTAGIGLAFAFVPYQDRPLETWVIAFFKAIFMPTIYLYKKGAKDDSLGVRLTDKTVKLRKNTDSEDEVAMDGTVRLINEKGKIKDFINSLPSVKLNIKVKEATNAAKVAEERKSKKINGEIDAEGVALIDLEGKPEEIKIDDWRDKKAGLDLKTEKLGATGQAVFGQIPMPDIPDIPNLIVGMATDKIGKIIEGVILEIRDEHGNPARVLKTNQLGQFKIASPLQNGKYLLIAEKEGHNFDRINIDLTGKIVQPIKIISN